MDPDAFYARALFAVAGRKPKKPLRLQNLPRIVRVHGRADAVFASTDPGPLTLSDHLERALRAYEERHALEPDGVKRER